MGKRFRFGPIALTTTMTTNLLNPPAASGGVNAGSSGQMITLNHLSVTNKTGSTVMFSLWLGATGANAAGTEVIGQNFPVAAYDTFNHYGLLRLDTTDFLVGGASENTALTITGEGEIGVSG